MFQVLRAVTAIFALVAVATQVLCTLPSLDISHCSRNTTSAAVGELKKSHDSYLILLFDIEVSNSVKGCYQAGVQIALTALEVIASCWFLVYWCIRMAQTRCRFLLTFESCLLLLVLTPLVIEISLTAAVAVMASKGNVLPSDDHPILTSMRAMRVLRITRALLIMLLLMQIPRIRRIMHSLASARTELVVLLACLVSVTVVAATMIYEIESVDPETKFTSIPQSCWFCVGKSNCLSCTKLT